MPVIIVLVIQRQTCLDRPSAFWVRWRLSTYLANYWFEVTAQGLCVASLQDLLWQCRDNPAHIFGFMGRTPAHPVLKLNFHMPYISVEKHLPGITGLLEYRKETAAPIRDLTQLLLRGPSTLTEGERELIATVVSHRNQCRFCTTAHKAATDLLYGECETSETAREDIESTPVSEKMKALLNIAALVQQGGKHVTVAAVSRARDAGATDLEIHDTVLIAALFCLYNRYVDGLATVAPADPAYYEQLGARLVNHGYQRMPQVYEQLKKEMNTH